MAIVRTTRGKQSQISKARDRWEKRRVTVQGEVYSDSSASTAVSNHVAAADPHPGYVLESVLQEQVEDLVGAFVTEGTGIEITYDDGSNTLTFALSSATQASLALADTSVQPGDNVSDLTNDAGYITTETNPVFTASDVFGVTTADIANWDAAFGWGDHALAGYITAEVNDLSAAVTWANVPDANITQSSVVQHEAALTITESQISDLGNYLETVNNTNWSGTDLSLANGGTGASLTDPGADRVLFWDDSAGTVTWLTMGTNLTITGTTLDATGGGATGMADGTAGSPGWAFTTDTDTGFYKSFSNNLSVATGGTQRWTFGSLGNVSFLPIEGIDGSAATPSFVFDSDTDTGFYRPGANALSFSTGGTERLRLQSDGTLYATAIHNVGTPTGSANEYFSSGTYTPSPVGLVNVAATTGIKSQWMRVGNVVTVSGQITVDETSTGATQVRIPLPLASNFTVTSDLAGVATDGSDIAYLFANTSTDSATLFYTSTSAVNSTWVFQFTYEIK